MYAQMAVLSSHPPPPPSVCERERLGGTTLGGRGTRLTLGHRFASMTSSPKHSSAKPAVLRCVGNSPAFYQPGQRCQGLALQGLIDGRLAHPAAWLGRPAKHTCMVNARAKWRKYVSIGFLLI